MNEPRFLSVLVLVVLAAWLLVVLGSPSSADFAHAQPAQVPLTASYAILGGSGPTVQDNLTYVSDGVQEVVPLTTTPTVYMVDSGTQWSAMLILGGSSASQRWITTQDTSGVIGSPLTVALVYYHQFSVQFNFNVTAGGEGFSGPPVTYYETGMQTISPAPDHVWVDSGSAYSYATELPGSTANQRWILSSGGVGVVNQTGTIRENYYHQYLVSSSFSVVGGGAPSAPELAAKALGSPAAVGMTPTTQTTWFDAGANYSFTSPLTSSGSQSPNETWIGTVLVPSQSGTLVSMDNNGTVDGPISITPVFHHEYFVSVKFAFVGGSTAGLTPPAFAYEYFGNASSVSNDTAVWVDAETQYSVPATLCCTAYPSAERWVLANSTTGTIDSPTTISSTYFRQYFESFSYSIVGQQPSSSSTQPVLTYTSEGNSRSIALLLTPQTLWADANTTYSAPSTLSASTTSERWFATLATGVMTEASAGGSTDIAYSQQYLLTVAGGGPPNQWVNAGNTTLSMPGIFGRSAGIGERVVSYQIGSGGVVQVTKPTGTLSIPISMNGPQSIYFNSVTQFEVVLDQGATGALYTITPPTITGDNYWYDTGSPVQVVLAGTWGRADGVGYRITSVSVTSLPTVQVDTAGTVKVFSTSALQATISITTTSATQYEVVLNGPAKAAFSSISPASTFPNDTFWYDSGSPAVTVVLHGVYSRFEGIGMRTASWELDSGAVEKVAQTGPISIVTKPMTGPQFVNATSVTQYQVTYDKGASSALISITSPTIPLDTGWYDASSPVGLVLKGAWDRSAGTGQRLSGYSLNGGAEVEVNSTGQVEVLDLTAITSPESVNTTIVTQYEVTLDSGAAASLSSITPTPVPKDGYWYDAGTPVTVTLDSVWGRTATAGMRLVSFSLNLGASTTVLSPSPVKVLSVPAISAPESITTKTVAQYHLTSTPLAWVSVTNSTLPGDTPGWFDAGTKATAVFDSVWNQTSGSRESVVSYALNGGGKNDVTRSSNGTFTVAVSMTEAEQVVLTSVTQYLLTVVGPPHVTTSPTSPTADDYFDSGSKVKLTVPSVWNGTSGSGTEETLTSYSIDGAPAAKVASSSTATSFTTPVLTFTGPQTVDFGAVSDYEVEFQFFDGFGNVAVQPSAIILGIGNTTLNVQGASVWLGNGTTFTVTNVSWEGASVGPSPSPSYEVKAAPLNVTLDTQVYPASLSVVDPLGLPVSGAQVSMTLANGTTVTGTTTKQGTFSAGLIPVGTYVAKVTSLGTSVQIRGDAAGGQSVAVGRVALSLIMVFVVIAAAAAAGSTGFFVYRRRKRAKKTGSKVSEPK